jgi:hypothetical protein
MTTVHYIARARDSRVLELPEEAEILGLKPGDVVSVSVNRADDEAPKVVPNEKALAALREIARRQEGRRHTDGSQTERIIREGRAGAMYGSDPAE